MAIHLYHPNKAIKGFACSFWFSDRNDAVFATLIKQSGWDEKNQNGTFKESLNDPNRKVSIKLSYVEVSAILDCIERNRPFTTFHDSEEAPKSINFIPWLNADKTIKGYSFSITVGNKQDSTFKNSFYIGLTFAEARYIREFLIFCLNAHFIKTRAGTSSVAQLSDNKPARNPEPQAESEPPNNTQAPESKKDNLIDF